jgi:hypothetical protein
MSPEKSCWQLAYKSVYRMQGAAGASRGIKVAIGRAQPQWADDTKFTLGNGDT